MFCTATYLQVFSLSTRILGRVGHKYTSTYTLTYPQNPTRMKMKRWKKKSPQEPTRTKVAGKESNATNFWKLKAEAWVVTDFANTRKRNPRLAMGNPRRARNQEGQPPLNRSEGGTKTIGLIKVCYIPSTTPHFLTR